MTPVIEASGLTKHYGSSRGITDLQLRVDAGEIYGYLGPNGSGKTTTIRLLLGFIRPDKGSVKIFGQTVSPRSTPLRARLGYVPGETLLPENTSGIHILKFYEKLTGLPCKNRGWLCSQLQLMDADLRRPIRSLSRGTRQKIAIVQALQHDPDLIILDEPTSGLDPLSQEAFFDVLHDLRDHGKTIFFSSHVLSEVQRLADRVAVLRDGEKVLESTMQEMAAQSDRLLWFKPSVTGEEPPAINGARFIRQESGGWLLYLMPPGETIRLVDQLGVLRPADFRLEPALEESFLKLYGVQVRSLSTREERP